MLEGKKIWDLSRIADREDQDIRRLELTDLIRFKDYWYCGFHEGTIHDAHPTGRARIIRSADGEHWESVALFRWDGADVREPKLSITAEGWLMVNTSLSFVSKQPRSAKQGSRDAVYLPHDALKNLKEKVSYYQLDSSATPQVDTEDQVARQSVTWLSRDGQQWSNAYTCPSGVNNWRWEVKWYRGMGYSVGYGGKDHKGTLYRTRDGMSWRPLLENFFPPQGGNEATLEFGEDHTAYCMLRDAILRKKQPGPANSVAMNQVRGTCLPMLGIGKAPYYTQWDWRELSVDYGPELGGIQSAESLLLAPLGGPKLIRLIDGRLIVAARMLSPGRDDGHNTLFHLDPDKALLTYIEECNGSSYPGLVEHQGELWITATPNKIINGELDNGGEIHLFKMPLPQ